MASSSSFDSWQRVMQRTQKITHGTEVSKWPSPAAGLLLRHATGSAHACWEAVVEARLVQLATIKANCHVANTTLAPPRSQNATPPFVVFIIMSLRFVIWARQQLAAGAEVPFRAPIQGANLLLRKIGNNMGHLSAMVP